MGSSVFMGAIFQKSKVPIRIVDGKRSSSCVDGNDEVWVLFKIYLNHDFHEVIDFLWFASVVSLVVWETS